MPGTNRGKPWRTRALIAGSLMFALFTGACSSGGGFSLPAAAPADTSHGFSGSGSISDFFTGTSAKDPQTATGGQSDVNCPPVEVRQGASTLSIAADTNNKSAMALKYQGEFTREARDCAVVSGNLVMRIGVQGRVIPGPLGGPGQVEVPLRIAVVQETPGGARPVATKFIRIPVAVASNDGGVFTHVEQGMTFPLPTPMSYLDDYIVYVGFDPLSAQSQDKQKEPPAPRAHSKPKTKLKPQPSASAN